MRRSRLHHRVRDRAAAQAVKVLAGLGAGFLTSAAVLWVLIVRVLRAERDAVRPPTVVRRPGHRPAIAVFGAETRASGPSGELVARLDHARTLLEAGLAEVIVVSGGTSGDLDEVDAMVAWLVERKVPRASIESGRPGANTRQSAGTLARLSRQRGFGPWIAVSTPFHARRIRDEARRVGIEVVVSGPADSPEMRDSTLRRSRVVTEAVATAFYLLPESVTSRVRTSAGSWRHSLPLRLAGRQ